MQSRAEDPTGHLPRSFLLIFELCKLDNIDKPGMRGSRAKCAQGDWEGWDVTEDACVGSLIRAAGGGHPGDDEVNAGGDTE